MTRTVITTTCPCGTTKDRLRLVIDSTKSYAHDRQLILEIEDVDALGEQTWNRLPMNDDNQMVVIETLVRALQKVTESTPTRTNEHGHRVFDIDIGHIEIGPST